jgi:hypothetical protein
MILSPFNFFRPVLRFFFLSSLWLVPGCLALFADDTGVGPNLLSGDFDSGFANYNPWSGVDDAGNLHVPPGSQQAVGDSGMVSPQAFSPGISVGDLNGDGLKDLVVADAHGFFWYYPNSGKANAPVFTHAEVMPIWLGGDEFEGNSVPRFQLVDFTGDGKLSLVAGNYLGGLYYLRNNGSPTAPDFRMPPAHDDLPPRQDLEIPTRSDGKLWCNYLSPFLYDWSGTGRLDLIMGDGSYSANSIYLFTNLGNNDHPKFDDQHKVKIIPGMGREHLTPQVVDWNGDGKPAIICGEREGYIDVYVDQAASKTDPPTYDPDHPEHVMFGTTDKVGALTTVCAADLNGDKLPDLIVGSPDGRILYSLNIGAPGAPKFGPLVPIKGTNPYPPITRPRTWAIDAFRPGGWAYGVLECVNARTEPGFAPPPGSPSKGAMKFSMLPPANTYFTTPYTPEDPTHYLHYYGFLHLDVDKSYNLSYWVRAVGEITGLTYYVEGFNSAEGADDGPFEKFTGATVSPGTTWTKATDEIRIPSTVRNVPEGKQEVAGLNFWLTFQGNGTLYITDISLKKAQ